MFGTKSIFASKTFWGALIAGGSAVAGAFGHSIADLDQQGLVDAVTGIAGALGALFSIYGRVTATKKIEG